jgi:hypothetical protein
MGKFYNISLAVFAATGSFLFGYDQGVMTDVIQSHHFLNYFNTVSPSAPLEANADDGSSMTPLPLSEPSTPPSAVVVCLAV